MTQITNPYHDRIIVTRTQREYEHGAAAHRAARVLRPVRRRTTPRALAVAASLLAAVSVGFAAGRADATASSAYDCTNGLGSYEIGCKVLVPGRPDGWFVSPETDDVVTATPDLSRVR